MTIARILFFILIAIALFAAGHHWHVRAQQPALSGHPYVVDGDSLKIGEVRIRLVGIDAPELEQTCTDGDGKDYRCGLLAASALEEMIAGRPVICAAQGTDKYQRMLATCQVNGADLGDYMVRSGMAVAYHRYSERYSEAEQEARTYHRGIWAGRFQAPEDFRHRQK